MPWKTFREEIVDELGTTHASVGVHKAEDASGESHLKRASSESVGASGNRGIPRALQGQDET